VQTADTSYTYDDTHGNLKKTTTYARYGQMQCGAGNDWYPVGSPGGGSDARETTTAYDSTYHLYPVQTCNAINHCVTTQYYGVGVPADYGLPGQVKKVTDPNNASTEYRYDDFGRSTHVRAPYDPGWGWDQVSTYVAYTDFGQAGKQRIATFGGQNAVWQEQYLDGLGRTIQVHESADGGQEVRHSTEYDGLGRAVKQWVPYYGTHGEIGEHGAHSYIPPSGGLPKTITTYDALGRVIVVENPDGTKSYQRYVVQNNLLFHSVFDENQHARNQVYDGLGRLVKVYEYTGDCTNGTMPAPYQGLMCGGAHQTPYALYADTIYTYRCMGLSRGKQLSNLKILNQSEPRGTKAKS
jgi:YD repeat-containing protein